MPVVQCRPTKTTSELTIKPVFLPVLTVLCRENTPFWSASEASGGRVGISTRQTQTWSCGAKGTRVNTVTPQDVHCLWRICEGALFIIRSFGWLLRHNEDKFTVKQVAGPHRSKLKLCSRGRALVLRSPCSHLLPSFHPFILAGLVPSNLSLTTKDFWFHPFSRACSAVWKGYHKSLGVFQAQGGKFWMWPLTLKFLEYLDQW